MSSKAVGEPLARSSLLLGLVDEADDFLKGAVLGPSGDLNLDGTPEVEGAAENFIPFLFFHRNGFSGEVGFVGRRFPAD